MLLQNEMCSAVHLPERGEHSGGEVGGGHLNHWTCHGLAKQPHHTEGREDEEKEGRREVSSL